MCVARHSNQTPFFCSTLHLLYLSGHARQGKQQYEPILGSRKRRNFRKLTNASFPAQRGPQPTTSPSPSLSRPKPAFQPQTRCPGQTLPCSPNLVFQLQTRSEPKPAFQPEAGFPAVPTAQISLSRSKSCPPVENPVGQQSLLGWRESFLGWRAGFGLEGGCCRCPPSKQLV